MKKILGLLICFLSITCIFSYALAAGSYKISYSTSTINKGSSLTVTITASNITGRFNIASSNTAVATVSSSSIWLENNSQKITIKSVAAGTSKITITPVDVADSATGDDITSSLATKTINLTVKEKASTGTQTQSKSTDATLKSLRLSVEGMSPTFNKNTTAYNLNVSTSVTSISVTASVNNSKAKYSVKGNTNLKEGTNTIKVVVTAEAGNTKTYTITVTRAADPKKANANLHNLIVSNAVLNEEFTTENLNYTLQDVASDIEKLEISAYPENTNAKVSIIGNEKLLAGENTVIVKVTAQDKVTVKEYTLKFNKLEDKTPVVDEQQEPEENKPQGGDVIENSGLQNVDGENKSNIFAKINDKISVKTVLVAVYVVAIIELLEIIYLYVRLKSYKRK